MADAPRRTGPRHYPMRAIGLVVIPAEPHALYLGTSRRLLCVRAEARTVACRRRALETVEKVVTAPTMGVVEEVILAILPGQAASSRTLCWSGLYNGCSRVSADALQLAAELGDAALVAVGAGMAALVLLTGCLPSHPKLRGDLRPPAALADSGVDEHRQLCLSIVSLDPDLPDLLQHLGVGQLGDSLRRTRLPHRCLVAPIRLNLPGSQHRLALRLAHQSSMRARTDSVVLTGCACSSGCDLHHIVSTAKAQHRTVMVFCGRLRTIMVAAYLAGGSCMVLALIAQW